MVTIICERLYLTRTAKPYSSNDRTSSLPPSLAAGGCGAIFIRAASQELLRVSFSPARRAKERLDENAFFADQTAKSCEHKRPRPRRIRHEKTRRKGQ